MALLEVSNLGIAFGGLQAVSQLDLKIEKGHLYGLIGPNGAGKTTVFNMLTGVYKPTEGNIVLDGNDITGATPEAISKAGIARTFQNIRLFKKMTVIENVKTAMQGHTTYGMADAIFRTKKYWQQEAEITERAMAKRPENRYKSAAEMLEALNAYVENPAIVFNYTYLPDEIPEKVVEPPMPRKESRPERGSAPAKGRKKKKRTVFLPVLFGITVAFALACAALCWMILNDSSSLMGEKADVVLADYSGMTQDEVNASQQVASGQIVINWEQAYSNDYAAGYVYRQSPVAGRTVREGQSVTLTVSLGIQYVTVPDVSNYVQADGEQQLKDLGVSVLITQAVEPSVAAGSIIRTEPAAGSQVAAGSTVVVYVSRPQVNTTAKVPALTGLKSVNDARSVLVQNKLGLGSTTEQYSDQPAGTIIGQSPAAGSTVKVNSRVSITVSAGPEPVPETPAEQPGSSSSDWWSGLIGGSSSSSGDSSSSEGTGLGDWWSALLS